MKKLPCYTIRRTDDPKWWIARWTQQTRRIMRLTADAPVTRAGDNSIGRCTSLYDWFDHLYESWRKERQCVPYANTQQQMADRSRDAEAVRQLLIKVDARLEEEFNKAFAHWDIEDVPLEEKDELGEN